MKKCLSMFLVLALLVTLYGGAFADTLQLPGSLTAIEAESFSDNPALDEVCVAWGTEKIESRAFASSGVKKIYIPATVIAIADDAFAGTSITICSAADAYARQYADAHGLAWEEAKGAEQRQILQMLDVILNDDTEGGKLSRLGLISPEEAESPEEAAEIAQYNALAAEANDAIEAYNAGLDELAEAADSFGEAFADVSCRSSGSGTVLSVGGLNLAIDSKLANLSGLEFTDAALEDDGTVVLKARGGAKYYLVASGDTVFLSETRIAAANGLAELNADGAWWAKAMAVWDAVTNWTGVIEVKIDEQIAKCRAAYEKAKASVERLESCRYSKLGGRKKQKLADDRQIVKQTTSDLKMLNWAKGALAAIDIGNTSRHIQDIFQKNQEVGDYLSHHHPTEHNTTPYAVSVSRGMNSDIEKLMIVYATDMCTTIASFCAAVGAAVEAVCALIALPAPPLAGGLAGAAGVTMGAAIALGLAGAGLQKWEASLYGKIKEDHDKLHTYVYGWVKERGTGKPIEGVKVTDGEVTTVTDGNGYYELYLMPEPTSLVFTHDDYEKDGIVAAPVAGEGTRLQDMELKIGEKGIPIDEEHFPDEAFRSHIAGQYDKNKDGRLSQEERDAVVTVTVRGLGIRSLQGIAYFEQMDSLYCENNRITTLDLRANKKLAWLWCCQNELTSLDLRGYEELKGLYCYGNLLSAVDASGCAKLRYVELSAEHDGVFLETSCGSLNLSGCEKLEELKCNQCRLGSLNVAGCGKLFDVHLEGCGLTGVLDLSLADTLSECKFKGNGFSVIYVNKKSYFYAHTCRYGQEVGLEGYEVFQGV